MNAQEIGKAPTRVRAPFQFTFVGITYSGSPSDFEVRVKTAGRIGDWVHLDTDPSEGPDPSSSEYQSSRLSTVPLWTGPGDEIELRVESGNPNDVRVHFIDATGRSRPLAARLRDLVGTAAVSASPMPRILSRAEWGADESLRNCGPSYASHLKGAFLHHTATSNSYSPDESAAIVRSIYYYHTQINGWCDIGYNFLVDRYGVVFEGRYGGIDRAVVGAHAGGFNTGSTGISFIGDFVNVDPTIAGLNSIIQLLGWKFTVHLVFPKAWTRYTSGGSTKYPPGTEVDLPTIAGHKDVSATACPARIYDRLQDIRNSVSVDFLHPNGTLVKGSGPAVFLIEAGRKRVIPSPSVLTSQYKWSEVVATTDIALGRYPDGSPVGYREGSLVRTPNGTVWVVSDGKRRGFTSAEAFIGLGYKWSNVVDVSWAEAQVHAEGVPISAATGPPPNGSLVQGGGPAVYFIENGLKRVVMSPGALESRFRWGEIIGVNDLQLVTYPEGEVYGFRNGVLGQTPNGTVWIISDGKSKGFSSAAIFEGLRYAWSNLLAFSWGEASTHPEDAPVTAQ